MKLENELIDLLESSGLSIKQFCRAYDLDYHNLVNAVYAGKLTISQRLSAEDFIERMK